VNLIYLDSVIVIYAVERPPPFGARATARIAALRAAGDRAVVSDLTWLECRIKPLRLGDAALLADLDSFFTDPDVVRVALPTPVYERATLIRAWYNYRLGDALHLAAAVEAGCSTFLTNDRRLHAFPDLTVELLP
jgi:predicted nucleic acid-binding protein